MNFIDLYTIAERNMSLINPTSPEKILQAGRLTGMSQGKRVIDFGCGAAGPLTLWGREFGIGGVGIEVREAVCQRARQNLAEHGLDTKIEIVQGKGAEVAFEPGGFDVAACIGASFIWNGFDPAIKAMRIALASGGRMIIGEPYWLTSNVPDVIRQKEAFHTEVELLRIIRASGCDLVYVMHSNRDEWDRYICDNWLGWQQWLDENPDHPERNQVLERLRNDQDEYLTWFREYVGWALYVLRATEN
jgi:SAM-dependent methyltransferase